MFERTSRAGKVAFTFLFAGICITAGFLLATGWETPTRLTAGPSTIAPISGILANAGAGAVPLLDEEGQSPFVRVAEIVKPTVVNITAEKTVSGHPAIPFDIFDFGPFFNQPPRNRGQQRRMPQVSSGGSGIIVDKNGFILTNNHVVADATEITVKFSDKSSRPAKVVGTDRETDVALIKVEGEIPPDMVAQLGNSDNIRIGDWAIAVGNPFGLDWTVTVGVISARGRSNLNIAGEGPSYQDFIQTDASINFGNSGGPLVNIRGEVIGVNTAINAQGQGIGFAIPINLASKVMNQLITGGEVKRGYLGVVPNELDEIKREALGLDLNQNGVFVDDVQVGTPADKGGLKGGDVIVELDGKPVNDVSNFRFRIADHPPGSSLKMTVIRSGKRKEMTFKLADRKEFVNASATSPALRGDQYWLGIEVAPTDSRAGREWGLEEMKGALVVRVQPESPAEGLIEPGDIIVEVGGMEVNSVEDYRDAAEKLKERKKAIPFWVMREGRRTFIPVRPAQ